MIDESLWTDLEAEHPPGHVGRVRRRLYTLAGDRGVFAAVQHPVGQRLLLIELDEAPPLEPEAAAGVSAEVELDAEQPTLRVALTDPQFADLFTALSHDLAEEAAAAPVDTARAVYERIGRWMLFLARNRGDALGPLAQRGLWGELHVLRGIAIPAFGVRGAIEGWRGPFRAVQDFQVGDTAAEVKTTVTGRDQRFRITSERQLDPAATNRLFLIALVVDQRPGAGETLNDLVDDLRSITGNGAGERRALESALLASGFSDIHRVDYETTGYTLRELRAYDVVEGFPRLTEADLPAGVGRVSYEISASACDPFSVDANKLSDLLNGRT